MSDTLLQGTMYRAVSDTEWESGTVENKNATPGNARVSHENGAEHGETVPMDLVENKIKRKATTTASSGRRSARLAGGSTIEEKKFRRMTGEADSAQRARRARTRGKTKRNIDSQQAVDGGVLQSPELKTQPPETREHVQTWLSRLNAGAQSRYDSTDGDSTDEEAKRAPLVSMVVKPVEETCQRKGRSVISPYAIPLGSITERGRAQFRGKSFAVSGAEDFADGHERSKKPLSTRDTKQSMHVYDTSRCAVAGGANPDRRVQGGDLQKTGTVEWGDKKTSVDESVIPPHSVRVSKKTQEMVERFMNEERARIEQMMASKEFLYVDSVAGSLLFGNIDNVIDHWEDVGVPIEVLVGEPEYEEDEKEEDLESASEWLSDDYAGEDDRIMDEEEDTYVKPKSESDQFIKELADNPNELEDQLNKAHFIIGSRDASSREKSMMSAVVLVLEKIKSGNQKLAWQDRAILEEYLKETNYNQLRTPGGAPMGADTQKYYQWFSSKWAAAYIKAYRKRKRALDTLKILARPTNFRWFKVTSAFRTSMNKALASVHRTKKSLARATVNDLIENDDVRTMFADLTASFYNEAQAVQQRRPFLQNTREQVMRTRGCLFSYFRKCEWRASGVVYTGRETVSGEDTIPLQTYLDGDATTPEFFI